MSPITSRHLSLRRLLQKHVVATCLPKPPWASRQNYSRDGSSTCCILSKWKSLSSKWREPQSTSPTVQWNTPTTTAERACTSLNVLGGGGLLRQTRGNGGVFSVGGGGGGWHFCACNITLEQKSKPTCKTKAGARAYTLFAIGGGLAVVKTPRSSSREVRIRVPFFLHSNLISKPPPKKVKGHYWGT